MKGDEAGLAMALGNLFAPYVIVAVCAGLTARRWWSGALFGIIASEAILAGFYATWATYLGHEVSPSAAMLWCGAGVCSGSLFGAVGWAARARRRLRYVLPALLLLEPVATQVSAPVLARFGYGDGWGVITLSTALAYLIEIAVGAVVFIVVRWHVRAHRRSGATVAAA